MWKFVNVQKSSLSFSHLHKRSEETGRKSFIEWDSCFMVKHCLSLLLLHARLLPNKSFMILSWYFIVLQRHEKKNFFSLIFAGNDKKLRFESCEDEKRNKLCRFISMTLLSRAGRTRLGASGGGLKRKNCINLKQPHLERKHKANSVFSASPVGDGNHLISSFSALLLLFVGTLLPGRGWRAKLMGTVCTLELSASVPRRTRDEENNLIDHLTVWVLLFIFLFTLSVSFAKQPCKSLSSPSRAWSCVNSLSVGREMKNGK